MAAVAPRASRRRRLLPTSTTQPSGLARSRFWPWAWAGCSACASRCSRCCASCAASNPSAVAPRRRRRSTSRATTADARVGIVTVGGCRRGSPSRRSSRTPRRSWRRPRPHRRQRRLRTRRTRRSPSQHHHLRRRGAKLVTERVARPRTPTSQLRPRSTRRMRSRSGLATRSHRVATTTTTAVGRGRSGRGDGKRGAGADQKGAESRGGGGGTASRRAWPSPLRGTARAPATRTSMFCRRPRRPARRGRLRRSRTSIETGLRSGWHRLCLGNFFSGAQGVKPAHAPTRIEVKEFGNSKGSNHRTRATRPVGTLRR